MRSHCFRCNTNAGAAYKLNVEQLKVTTVNDLPKEEAECILCSIAGISRFDEISHSQLVTVCGTEYRSNMVLVAVIQ